MKKLMIRVAAAAAMMTAMPAFAAVVLSPLASDGSVTGAFSETNIASGAFSFTETFNLPQMGIAGATISSIFNVSNQNNIDFTSVTFNGTPFAISSMGNVEFRSLENLVVVGGLQNIVVAGTSGGNGSFAGTISFTPGAIPEPTTWAMMIGGFGLVGGAMRRRVAMKSVAA